MKISPGNTRKAREQVKNRKKNCEIGENCEIFRQNNKKHLSHRSYWNKLLHKKFISSVRSFKEIYIEWSLKWVKQGKCVVVEETEERDFRWSVDWAAFSALINCLFVALRTRNRLINNNNINKETKTKTATANNFSLVVKERLLTHETSTKWSQRRFCTANSCFNWF